MYMSGKQRKYLREALDGTSTPRRQGRRKPPAVLHAASRQEEKRKAAALDHAFSAMVRPLRPPGRGS